MKNRFLSLLCALILLVSVMPSAAAQEGESIQAANTLISLNLVDGGDQVPDGLDKKPAERAIANKLLLALSGVRDDTRNTIDTLVDKGWVAVTGKQSEAIPADEFFRSLLLMLGYSDSSGKAVFSGDAAVYARHIGLAARDYSGPMTLGDLYQAVRDALPFHDAVGKPLIQRLVDQGTCSRQTAEELGFFNKELTVRQAADRLMPAVFGLKSYDTDKEYKKDEFSGEGSGFFITPDGLAVTNYHTIDEALHVTATLVTGEVYEAEKVIYYDDEIDIALIKISQTSKDGVKTPAFATLELAGSKDLRPGDPVYTLGNPLGLGLAVSNGIVSAVGRVVDRYSLPCIMNTADISQGSSGGALLNIYGHVVGVTSGAFTYGNNMYLAVPVDPVLEADWGADGFSFAEVDQAVRDKINSRALAENIP